ncbi:Retrovirus-related Pol polyprotein from transposon TNT 1-94 [Vitis vinifera]|uniref:Retrovirus-related Pol polyprotein from transposon TNT 1-94 n=1 Tax=Vitis vinifera TaxID=29760 RepID=A0A438HTV2_VITVI|nr:Retrovirus-related Pol polyprotein from transposon TNT 1-94 [Vitis vinifera]
MNKAKVVSSPLATHFRLSTNQSPSIDQEKEEIEKVSYASTVRSLMYVMVCTCLDIAYAIGTGTSSMSLCFGCEKLEFIGYTDADMAGDIDSCR